MFLFLRYLCFIPQWMGEWWRGRNIFAAKPQLCYFRMSLVFYCVGNKTNHKLSYDIIGIICFPCHCGWDHSWQSLPHFWIISNFSHHPSTPDITSEDSHTTILSNFIHRSNILMELAAAFIRPELLRFTFVCCSREF